jgi:peptidoglycan hydrolase CwlO-like protein
VSLAYYSAVTTPGTGRQLRQQRADIDSLYELVSTVDQKLTNLTGEVAEVRREMTTGFAEVHSALAQILERLDR